jgi:hypothetical protein
MVAADVILIDVDRDSPAALFAVRIAGIILVFVVILVRVGAIALVMSIAGGAILAWRRFRRLWLRGFLIEQDRMNRPCGQALAELFNAQHRRIEIADRADCGLGNILGIILLGIVDLIVAAVVIGVIGIDRAAPCPPKCPESGVSSRIIADHVRRAI